MKSASFFLQRFILLMPGRRLFGGFECSSFSEGLSRVRFTSSSSSSTASNFTTGSATTGTSLTASRDSSAATGIQDCFKKADLLEFFKAERDTLCSFYGKYFYMSIVEAHSLFEGLLNNVTVNNFSSDGPKFVKEERTYQQMARNKESERI